MNRKIVGILICTLLIFTIIPNVCGNNLFENILNKNENVIHSDKITSEILFSDDCTNVSPI